MTATIGAPAPDFELPATDKTPTALSSFRGHNTLVVFIPFPFTGNCTNEACTLRDHLSDLASLDANVVVITCDTPYANRVWAEQNGLTFPVLSDFWPHGEVARSYGAFNEPTGSATRSTFVLDADGIVRDIIATGSLGIIREYDAYVSSLSALGS
jgi:mycoredoxin-dependent peroxiredoxin